MKHNQKELNRLRNLAANTNPATAGAIRKAKSYARVFFTAMNMGDFDAVREVLPFTGFVLREAHVTETAEWARENGRREDKVKCAEWLSR